MNQIFYSKTESRLRAGWRIAIFSSVALVAVALFNLLSPTAYSTTVFLAVLMMALLWLASRFIDKRPFTEFGFNLSGRWFRDFAAGILIAAIAMSIIYGILLWMGWVLVTDAPEGSTQEVLTALLPALLLMTCVSIWEEAYFRGYLILNIKEGVHSRRIGNSTAVLVAVVASSLLFGMGHLNNPGATGISTLNLVVAGMVLAYPFIVTGNLALPVGIHLSWNFCQGAIFGMPVSGNEFEYSMINSHLTGPEAFTGGSFGPEAGASGLLGLMILVTLTEIYLSRFKKQDGIISE